MGNPTCLLYLVDAANSRRYLVDSGSAYSIIPHKSAAAPTGPHLVTADGTPLKCWGHRTCTVHTRNKKFTRSFLLASVASVASALPAATWHARAARKSKAVATVLLQALATIPPLTTHTSTSSLPTMEAPVAHQGSWWPAST